MLKDIDLNNKNAGNSVLPKIIAFYLPQYHCIPENDAWWCKGFTEWVNVKKAKPIYKGQIQPKIPLNNNYYNLLSRETVEWQTNLANEYGVYGFCYWHYYFQGKKLLEKPAENLLKWSDIPQNFCFGWANVTWARTWKHTQEFATTWVIDDKKDSSANGVLIEQTYGTEEDWIRHINYLLPFFKDSRYIKKDRKPLFLIYQVHKINDAEKMFSVWNAIARNNGFPGVHIVSIDEDGTDIKGVEANAHYNFGDALDKTFLGQLYDFVIRCWNKSCSVFHVPLKVKWKNYELVWKAIISRQPSGSIPNYPGATVRYDDTPRKGERGTYLKNDSPRIFQKYMIKQLKRARSIYHSPFLFLDSWNEWAEGNFLEPDEQFGYGYLEALKTAIATISSEF